MKRVSTNNGSPQKRQRRQQKPSKVLHVRNLPEGTTETELVEIVAPYGEVVKCLLITTGEGRGRTIRQAFVQMESIDASRDVIDNLKNPKIRGTPIHFQFSSRSEVEVKTSEDNNSPKKPSRKQQQERDDEPTCVILLSLTNCSLPVTLDNIYHICKSYGQVEKIVSYPKADRYKALVQFATITEAKKARKQLDGKDLFQDCCHIRSYFSERSELTVRPPKENRPKRSRDYTKNPMALMSSSGLLASNTQQHQQSRNDRGRGGGGEMAGQGVSTVVLVTPLVPEKINTSILFNLFGVYGRIMKIKILYKKRQTALIQYATRQQAHLAQTHLHKCVLQGKKLTVVESRMTEIQLPKMDENEENLLTKDYSDSSLNRRRFKNVFSPSQVLYVANLHDNATEQELQDLFGGQQTIGAQEPIVDIFQHSKSQAYVCMNSIDDAVEALVNLHGSTELDDGRPLRINFSKKDPSGVRSSALADDDSS